MGSAFDLFPLELGERFFRFAWRIGEPYGIAARADWLSEKARLRSPKSPTPPRSRPPAEQITVKRVARHLNWYFFAEKLSLGAEDFRRRSEAGRVRAAS